MTDTFGSGVGLSPLSTKPRIETVVGVWSRNEYKKRLSPLSTKPRIETCEHRNIEREELCLSPLSTKPRIETGRLVLDGKELKYV